MSYSSHDSRVKGIYLAQKEETAVQDYNASFLGSDSWRDSISKESSPTDEQTFREGILLVRAEQHLGATPRSWVTT